MNTHRPSPQPQTSVVVLCYNGLEQATRPCIESVLRNTEAGTYELVLVDNASVDDTPSYLRTLREKYDHIRIHINTTNKGYAGGNNDGMRLANGNYIVLLNNDTLVPPGWLDRLLRLLILDPQVGLVGPVTNSAGNEQRIDLSGLTEKNFESVAGEYTGRQAGYWFTTNKLGFFCVAMRQELVQEVGLLDEEFGIGMFEDDDYCVRVSQKGHRLVVAEDCFVFHKGSVSFSKLEVADYARLFIRNRDYFYRKHGRFWSFSDIAGAIWRRVGADLGLFFDNADTAALERVRVRCLGLTGAIAQLKDVEARSGEVAGKSLIEIQLAEKQKQLSEKHSDLMAMSDWATGLKSELDALTSSRLFPIFKWMQRKGL